MLIEIKDVVKKYGKKTVLDGVGFSAQSGDCIGILGANGSGKSTLLSILAAVTKSDGGEFLYDGRNLFDYPKVRSTVVGYVPQGTPLIEELSARDNLLLWYDREEMKHQLEDGVLKMLGIDAFLHTTVSRMSGGMKKRLSIGCAISRRPPVLLLDEPMAALDIACKQAIIEYLRDHMSHGGIVLISTHDVLELELCTACYIIKEGKLTPYEYTGDLESLVARL